MDDTSAPLLRLRDPMARPLLWRLPLIVFVLLGLAGLQRVDALLRRDYEREAEIQAQQAQALLGSFLRDRGSYLHGLTLSLAALGDVPGRSARFPLLAREFHDAMPEVVALTMVDTGGRVRERLMRLPKGAPARAEPSLPSVEQAVAQATARRTRETALTTSVLLPDGTPGIILYDPIQHEGNVVGFVSAAIGYRRLFEEALAGQLRGAFAYQVRDGSGEVIARSPDYPTRPQRVITRPVPIPAGGRWLVDIAVPRFEPFLPRILTALVGGLLLLSVVLLVLREEARAERLAQHSLQLELLSRDLLDANVRLEERAQQVAEANRAKSRFLANVSHELRTPLNAIVGYNALALDGMYGSMTVPLRDAHGRIQLAAEHLLALVDDVLDLSKIEVGRMGLETGPVDLRALLDSVVTVVEPIAVAKGVHVDVVLGRDLPRLTSDARHLRQILLNLASNAVKFTERGAITLVARRDPSAPESRVLITVEDTGIGIAAADLERIFEEFEQVRAGSRGDSLQRGTGLGLTIARKLTRILGGELTVESTPGVGSRFTMTIPIVAPLADTPPLVPPQPRRVVTPPPAVAARAEVERAVASSTGLGDIGGHGADVADAHPTDHLEHPPATRAAGAEASATGASVDAPGAPAEPAHPAAADVPASEVKRPPDAGRSAPERG